MAPHAASTATLVEAATASIDKAQPEPPADSAVSYGKPGAEQRATPSSTHEGWQIVWLNLLSISYLHIASVWGLYLILSGSTKLQTVVFSYALVLLGNFGVTAGAHRLWAHRAYKAKWPLRLTLMVFQTFALQTNIYEWVRDHRVHHKYTDTDADPHNASRGLFFSHVGWLMTRKHDDVKVKGAGIDLSDIEQDEIVMFQRKVYIWLAPLLVFVIPTVLPVVLWGEAPWVAWNVGLLRYTLLLNGTWAVNSLAHFYGARPLDRNISPSENAFVSYLTNGEGWHNYHHVFPWDYKAAELGSYDGNATTAVIDFFARIGWAYDLKTASREMIERRAQRTGDGSRLDSAGLGTSDGHHIEGDVWGWGDKDMAPEDVAAANITGRKTD